MGGLGPRGGPQGPKKKKKGEFPRGGEENLGGGGGGVGRGGNFGFGGKAPNPPPDILGFYFPWDTQKYGKKFFLSFFFSIYSPFFSIIL